MVELEDFQVNSSVSWSFGVNKASYSNPAGFVVLVQWFMGGEI
jgi:hypothetical protein